MSVIKIENLWKEYRLGVIGHGTLTHDLQSWWARKRGKEDPNSQLTPVLAGQEKQIDGNRFWALRDINLEVKQGEILGIIGKNGAGKSTLLKILSRVTAPTQGSIKVKGRIASLLEVGTGFHPELTGLENIFMNGAILGMSKQEIKWKLDEIIDFSGVEAFIDTPVKRYSSGMYVRLAFAVAAHLEPEILIVDEVLAVGDADFQKKCIGKMKDVSTQGRTVLVVSHNLITIRALCTHCIEIKNGSVAGNGNPKEIIQQYLHQNIKNENDGSGYIDKNASMYNTGHIKFTRLYISNEKEMLSSVVKYCYDINIHLQLTSDNSYSDLLFHVYIKTTEGLIVSYATNLYSDFDVCLKKGENNLLIKLSNNLQPASYIVSVSISKVDGITMEYVEDIMKFSISEPVIKRAIKWNDPYRGLTVMNSDWIIS